jgi:hypothetical protein
MARSLEELREYLVGEWNFNSNYLDSSGNGNHGTPTDIEWKPTARGLKPTNNLSGNIIVSNDYTLQLQNEITVSTWVFAKKWVGSGTEDYTSALSKGGWPEDYTCFVTSTQRMKFALNGTQYGGTGSIVPENNWVHLVWAYNGSSVKTYINGIFDTGENVSLTINAHSHDLYIGGCREGTYNLNGYQDDTRIYSTALSSDEVLALYNSTKNAVGVRPAERSFTHRLQPDVDDNTVFATDMSTRNADGTLMDLSGEGYAYLYGAVRDSGYFADAIRFDKDNENYGRILALNGEITDKLQVELLTIKHSPTASNTGVFDGIYLPQHLPYGIGINSYNTFYCADGDDNGEYIQGIDYTLGVLRHTIIDFDGEKLRMYDDGVKTEKTSSINQIQLPYSDFYLSRRVGSTYYYFDNTLYFLTISLTTESDSQIKSRFNSLATLPLYTFDASKYPTSSGWTSNVPYTSMNIASGEFSFTDDGQLQCDSAGSFSLRNSHNFDSDEYIKLTINGVEYSGTGSITQGNVTVSLTQGSNKIDVNMGTGDLIDGIDIQFREPVE